jgi:hypothetical protein
MTETTVTKPDTPSAFNVFIRVKPLGTTEEPATEMDPMIRIAENQIFVRDPSPLGDYIVLLFK